MLAVLKKILLDIVTNFNKLIKTFIQTLIVIYQLTDLTTLQLPLKFTNTDSNPYHIHSENYTAYIFQIILRSLNFYTNSGKNSSRDFYNGKKKTFILISNRYLDSTVRLANHKITMLLYNLFRKKEFNNGLLF